MKNIIFIYCILTTINSAAQDVTQFEKKIYISSKGDTLPYRILFPEPYDKTKKYPLILFLHGGGERGNDNEKQLTHGTGLFLKKENRTNYPCIVIFPQCPSNNYWASVKIDRSTSPITLDFDYTRPETTPLASAIELVHKISKEENIHKSQMYVMGLSMGGMGTFESVFRNPKLFSAAVPICGGADSARYDDRVKKVRFWIFHGENDKVVSVNQSRRMVARLDKLNVLTKYTEYPGVDHNSWDDALAEPDLLEWMFSNKR